MGVHVPCLTVQFTQDTAGVSVVNLTDKFTKTSVIIVLFPLTSILQLINFTAVILLLNCLV